MKISGPLVKALNNQISMEANAAHAYLAAGSWCEITGYDGSAAFFYAQAEDGIRDVERSRGLGDVYKRQSRFKRMIFFYRNSFRFAIHFRTSCMNLSLIHI